jgi:ribosomal protein L12E/L44/L45/RPP1/RPP2
VSIIRELAIKLGLDVDAASFAEGELAAKGIELGLEAIVEAAKKTVEFLVDVGKEAIEVASQLNDTSQAIGVTTDALQELQYAGGLAGVSADEMTQSVTLLSRAMAAAKAGGEEQAKAFSKAGTSYKDASGKLRPAEEVIGDIAEHFKTMPDGAEKTALAVQLFGRSGARMVSMLNEGKDGLQALRMEAHELGLVLDADTIKLGDDVGDNIDRIKSIFKALKVQVGSALFPILKQITDNVLNWVKANKELIKQRIEQLVKGIAKAALVLVDAVDVLWGSLKFLYHLIVDQLVAEFKIFMEVLDRFGAVGRVAALAFIAAWVLASAPIVAVVAAIAQLLLFLNSIQRWREGRDSVFGDWMKMLAEWQKPNANDPWWLKAIKELVIYMEKALGIAHKLGVAVSPDENKKPSSTGASAKIPFMSESTARDVPRPFISGTTQNGAPGTWLYGYHQARAAGVGVFAAATTQNAQFAEGPQAMLPPGGGVTRAPVHQDNRRSYVINQSPGMSAQEVVDLITQYDQDANDAAAAALR